MEVVDTSLASGVFSAIDTMHGIKQRLMINVQVKILTLFPPIYYSTLL